MGSFFGHVDEASFFFLLGLWWMVNIYKRYLENGCISEKYRSRISFDIPCCCCHRRRFPIETVCKISFILFGLLVEIPYSEGFVDEEGKFRDNLGNLQHISIYVLFLVHSIVDLLVWLKVPLPRGLDFITVALAFAWYGMAFYYHNLDIGDRLRSLVHIMPGVLMYGTAISAIWAYLSPTGVLPQLCGSFFLLNMGTWFTHVAYVLYDPTSDFPGRSPNYKYDRKDPNTLHYMIGMFGMHLGLNLTFMAIMFFIFFLLYTQKHRIMSWMWSSQSESSYKPVPQDINGEEQTSLI